MSNKRILIALGLSIIFSLGIGIFTGMLFEQALLSRTQNTIAVPKGDLANFQLLLQAYKTIQQNYVDQPAAKAQNLIYGAISGMADSLGDTGHSRFETPQMVKAERNYTQGTLEGIGAQVETKDGHTVVVAPIDNSPAQKAGILPGDIIQKVNGKDVDGLPLTDVVSQILGPAGTQVNLTILTPSTGKTRDLTITRAKITIQNVTWSMLPGTTIAHLRIAAFSQNVTRDLQTAIGQINEAHATGIVLDLRNDPGGLLDESVGVASQFLSSGNVLQEKNASGRINNVAVRTGGVATKIPMVVLVNQGTASASEIVTGALQDANRAKVIGDTTYGTGTVLTPFPLSDGSALLLATEEWLTPTGRTIWHTGLKPDIQVSLAASVTPLIPEAERSMTPMQLQASQDQQMLKAVQTLNQISAPSSHSRVFPQMTAAANSLPIWARSFEIQFAVP